MQQAAQAEDVVEHVVEIDGQLIPLDRETAATDEIVRQALRGIYPDIATATITRRTEERREVIAVVKRAGPKGISSDGGGDVERVLAALRAGAPAENPAIKLDRELRTSEARTDRRRNGAKVDVARDQIEDAILRGEEEARATARALNVLIERSPTTGRAVPQGF